MMGEEGRGEREREGGRGERERGREGGGREGEREVDLPEAVIVLTITALIPFTFTVLSSASGARGAAAADGTTGVGSAAGSGLVGGATVAAIVIIIGAK